MIKKYSFDVFKPNWPRWKIRLADFLLNSLRFLKVRKANSLLTKYGDFKNHMFIGKVTDELGHKFKFYGQENIPKTGSVTIIANHPGGADVLATINAIGEVRSDFVILANELICVEPVVDIVLPVNLLSRSSKIDLDAVHKAYADGKAVVYFAAGKNSRYNEKGELRDRKWRTTFLDFAMKYHTPVIVLNIGGSNNQLFYRVAKIRENNKRLKYVPLENFFQLRELIIPKSDTIPLLFSEPISKEYIEERLSSLETKEKRSLADDLYNFLYRMTKDNLLFSKK